MKRRLFITLLGGAAVAWPLAARAQQGERMRRIGVLMVLAESDSQSQRRITAFQEGLEKLGWTVGRNLAIDYRWGVSDPEGARATTSELLSLAPDLILANAISALRGAQQATHTVPIVFTGVRSRRASRALQLCSTRRQPPLPHNSSIPSRRRL